MSEDYEYLFHPSILRVSRQIEHEASHILYDENSLVRVSTCAFRHWVVDGVGRKGRFGCGYDVPILAAYERANNFTRHTMALVMRREDKPSERFQAIEWKFVIAGDDLQRFCHSLLMLNAFSGMRLDKLIIAIKVFTKRTTTITAPYDKDDTLIDSEGFLEGNCSIEATTSTQDDDSIASEMPLVGKAPIEEGPPTLDQAIGPSEQKTSIVSSPRVLKLLEPLHKLHSLQEVYIEGPIGDDHKADLLLSMRSPPPSDVELFDELFCVFEDAVSTYDAGDQEAGFAKLKLTRDTIKEQMSTRKGVWSGKAVIPQGAPYAGYTVWDASRDIEVQVWTRLAWKFLEIGTNPHVGVAQAFAFWILGESSDLNSYWNLPPQGNKAAMAFYLVAHAYEAQEKLKGKPRLRYLEDVVKYLLDGLRHEPDNLMIRNEMKDKQDELKRLKSLQEEPKDPGSTLEELDSF